MPGMPQPRKGVCVEGDFGGHFFVPHVPALLYAIVDWTNNEHQIQEQPEYRLVNT